MTSCKSPVRCIEIAAVLLLGGLSIGFGQSVTVISPNGLQEWQQSTLRTILFAAPSVTDVRIEFSSNVGGTWLEIVASTPASPGSYLWSLPDNFSDQCLVRISSVSNPSIADVSDRPFSIVAPRPGSELDFIFFADSPTPVFYDPSFGFVTSPSTLTLVGDKFPVTTEYSLVGNYSLKLTWNSQSGGDWGIAVAGEGWIPRDANRKDSLVFNVLSSTFMFSSVFPVVYLEDNSNNKTAKLPLRNFIGAIGQELWQRVRIPLRAFRDNPGQADLSQIKTIFFGQDVSDASSHTWYLDGIRMVSVRPFSDSDKVVAVLGSSSAAGVGPTTVDSAWVWRYRRYINGFDSSAHVVNFAVGGYSTYDVMPTGYVPPGGRPLPKPNNNISAALAYRPDAIIVALTSNDAAYGYTVDETMANFDTLRNRSLSAGVPIWITSCAPRNITDPARLNALIVTKDSILSRYAPRTIDFWNGFAQADGWILPQYNSGDGIHLSDAAHAILHDRVVSAGVWQTITSIGPVWRIPELIVLHQSYPNPFNPSTTIDYSLSSEAFVSLSVFDVLGREVSKLVNQRQYAGSHTVRWNAESASSGVYFYTLAVEGSTLTRKMILSK